MDAEFSTQPGYGRADDRGVVWHACTVACHPGGRAPDMVMAILHHMEAMIGMESGPARW